MRDYQDCLVGLVLSHASIVCRRGTLAVHGAKQLCDNRASSPSEKHGWRVFGGMMGPVQ